MTRSTSEVFTRRSKAKAPSASKAESAGIKDATGAGDAAGVLVGTGLQAARVATPTASPRRRGLFEAIRRNAEKRNEERGIFNLSLNHFPQVNAYAIT
jgi:hypothetical protein